MPMTATSLGRWMKQHNPGELSITTGRSPLRRHHNAPHGCCGHLKREYASRYGWQHNTELEDGSVERQLGVCLVSDSSAMFVFHPRSAPRLPHLSDIPDIAAKLMELTPGDAIGAKFYGGRPSGLSGLPNLYTSDNADMDYWYKGSCCAPTVIWARYEVTPDLIERNGVLWRRLHAPDVERFKTDGKMPWRLFPKERKATAGNFLTELHMQENYLHVLGDGAYELNYRYHFYVFKPNSRQMVVVDSRCNIIVAHIAGGTLKP